MEEKILGVLNEHPNGLRLREIGGYLHVWHIDLIGDIYALKKQD